MPCMTAMGRRHSRLHTAFALQCRQIKEEHESHPCSPVLGRVCTKEGQRGIAAASRSQQAARHGCYGVQAQRRQKDAAAQCSVTESETTLSEADLTSAAES